MLCEAISFSKSHHSCACIWVLHQIVTGQLQFLIVQSSHWLCYVACCFPKQVSRNLRKEIYIYRYRYLFLFFYRYFVYLQISFFSGFSGSGGFFLSEYKHSAQGSTMFEALQIKHLICTSLQSTWLNRESYNQVFTGFHRLQFIFSAGGIIVFYVLLYIRPD